MQKFHFIYETLQKECTHLAPDQPGAIQQAAATLCHKIDWTEILQDPFFSIPSRSVTPSWIAGFAQKYNLPMIRITNPFAEFTCPNQADDDLSAIEPLLIHLLNEAHEKGYVIDDEVTRCVSSWMKQIGYSENTSECVIKQCFQSKDLGSCIERCIQVTFNLKEKLIVALGSLLANRVLEKFKNARLNNFNFNLQITDLQEKIFDFALPLTSQVGYLEWIENSIYRIVLRNTQQKNILKYSPLIFKYGELDKKLMSEISKSVDRTMHAFEPVQNKDENRKAN